MNKCNCHCHPWNQICFAKECQNFLFNPCEHCKSEADEYKKTSVIWHLGQGDKKLWKIFGEWYVKRA